MSFSLDAQGWNDRLSIGGLTHQTNGGEKEVST